MAQSPTNDQYDDSSVTFLGGSGAPGDPSDPGTGTGTGTGSLPFSGLDAVLLGAMGGGLVLLGVGMRRLTGVPEEAA